MNDESLRSLASNTLAGHLERQHHSSLSDTDSIVAVAPEEVAASIITVGRMGHLVGVGPNEAFKIGFDLALAIGGRLGSDPFGDHDSDLARLLIWAKGQYGEAQDAQLDQRAEIDARFDRISAQIDLIGDMVKS